ncbi:hypothetical protein AS890_28810 [Rhizobium anhuiense bv. trifolii]|jgi:DNA-binding GntR family transcriptional regulator|nr:hypothetical protein AS890_28810 [Rhizobium anhuiense bv. trifolii]
MASLPAGVAMRNRMPLPAHTLRQGERLRRSQDKHEAIMQAIADGEMASRRMRAHMLNAATSLSRFIEAGKLV